MSAVSWLNRLRLNHLWGQSWMRLLITVSLCFDIRITCSHIPGVDNPIADGLSRYFQDTIDLLCRANLLQRPMPTWESRERWWRSFGTTGLLEEWSRIPEEPILQGSHLSPDSVSPWGGSPRI